MSLLGFLGLVLEQFQSLPGGKRSDFRSPKLFLLPSCQRIVKRKVFTAWIIDLVFLNSLKKPIGETLVSYLCDVCYNKQCRSYTMRKAGGSAQHLEEPQHEVGRQLKDSDQRRCVDGGQVGSCQTMPELCHEHQLPPTYAKVIAK